MRKRMVFWILAGASLLLAGCYTFSIYPYYLEKDLVFDPALLGNWTSVDTNNASHEIVTFERSGAQGYVCVQKAGEDTIKISMHLFRLAQQQFMDCQFLDVNKSAPGIGYVPTHFLLKVEQIQPTFKTASLDYDYISRLLEKDPALLRHTTFNDPPDSTNNSNILITADTTELQNFILKHLADTNMFTGSDEMKRSDGKDKK